MAMRQWRGWWQRPVVVGLLWVLAVPALGAENAASEARMRKDIFFLASDECEGRGITTQGINRAADYIAHAFAQAGLKPAGVNGTYFQPFTIAGIGQLGRPNALTLHGPQGQTVELALRKDFLPMGLSGSGKVNAQVVFVGYGATAADYDDYKDVDVAGKVVVILRRIPRADNPWAPFEGTKGAAHAPLQVKLNNARAHGAAAVLFLSHANDAAAGDDLLPFDYTIYEEAARLPALHVHRAVVDGLMRSSLGTSLHDREADIDRELKPRSAALDGWTAELQVTVNRQELPVKNVIGVLEPNGPNPSQETIVIGAHYDHLGYGGMGSLAGRLKKPLIHHGADDNGSGTTTVMELARRFAQLPNRNRRLVFMTFSGEESGLLGSKYYCNHPIFPLADTITMVNLDMVGRLRKAKGSDKDSLLIHGTGTAKAFDQLVDDVNKKYGFAVKKTPGGIGPSDHTSFYMKKVPVLFFFTDLHPDYHRPSDTADKINVPGMCRIADMAEDLVVRLLQAPARPEYVKTGGGNLAAGPVRGEVPRLGFGFSYGDAKEGVLLDSVKEDSPAAKAGFKEGDRIVEIGGKPVKNLSAYMTMMAGRKKGEAIEFGVLRDGKKVTLKATP